MTKLNERGWKSCVTDVWLMVDLLNVIVSFNLLNEPFFLYRVVLNFG